MQLEPISVFAKVVELRSFSLAARALGLPRSSVSRRVGALEEELGVRLLQRTTRTLALTDAGAAYYERVARALEALHEANGAVREMQGAPRGTIRFSTTVDAGVHVVAPIIAEFVQQHPGIRVDTELSSRRVDLVSEGVDVALRFGKLSDSSLVARRIARFEHRLLASKAYLDRRGEPKVLADLASHDFLLFRPKDGQNVLTLEGPKGPETVTVTGPIGTDDFAYMREMVCRGMGIALLPYFLIADVIGPAKLMPVLEDYSFEGADAHLVTPSGRFVPRRVSLFIDFLRKRLEAHAWKPADCPSKKKAAPAEVAVTKAAPLEVPVTAASPRTPEGRSPKNGGSSRARRPREARP